MSSWKDRFVSVLFLRRLDLHDRQRPSVPSHEQVKKRGGTHLSVGGCPLEGGSALLSRLRSTIGAPGLSFSVRDGKRRGPGATAALGLVAAARHAAPRAGRDGQGGVCAMRPPRGLTREGASLGNVLIRCAATFGLLVALGCGVAAYRPAPYRRPRLGRPS